MMSVTGKPSSKHGRGGKITIHWLLQGGSLYNRDKDEEKDDSDEDENQFHQLDLSVSGNRAALQVD